MGAADVIVSEDPEYFSSLDRYLRGLRYDGRLQGRLRTNAVMDFTCYGDDGSPTSFRLFAGDTLLTEEGYCYEYTGDERSGLAVHPEPIRAIKARADCARNLQSLARASRRLLEEAGASSRRQRWCDAIVAAYPHDRNSRQEIKRRFKCPAAEAGKCHYVLNVSCTGDSPADTVLLFESRPGWNQQGGVELFTFENHDPKGGWVVLKNETIIFIRSEEELHALRWR